MAVSVKAVTTDTVILAAPLEPNINHKHTVFGGSASALGILAAWSLLHVRLVDAGLPVIDFTTEKPRLQDAYLARMRTADGEPRGGKRG